MTIDIQGLCEELFLPLQEAFRENFDAGDELGASLAVTHRGTMVVDLWGGYTDLNGTKPWQQDTIVPVASTTKIMVTLAALQLVERGLLDLDAPVARCWPEFAAGGKAAVTVRDAFSHQAGVPGLKTPVPFDVQRDWSAITARLAAEPHWFAGRQQICYHAFTYGLVVGELIRRVDGRGPAQYFREEIADPAGADFQIGLTSKADLPRLAVVRAPEDVVRPPGVATQVYSNFEQPDDRASWESRTIEDPSGRGFGNGRSIARACTIIAMKGTLDGRRYLSERMVEQAGSEQAYGLCPLMGTIRWGLGFALDCAEYHAISPTAMHWGGFGGSWGIADPKSGISLGYAPNNFRTDLVDPRLRRIYRAMRKLLPQL